MNNDEILKESFISDFNEFIMFIVEHDFAVNTTHIDFSHNIINLSNKWFMPNLKFRNKSLETSKIEILKRFYSLGQVLQNPKIFELSENYKYIQPVKDSNRICFNEMYKLTLLLRNDIDKEFRIFCNINIQNDIIANNLSLENLERVTVNLIYEAICRRENDPIRLSLVSETDFCDDIRDIIEPTLWGRYNLKVEREKPSGYSKKTIGETDINIDIYCNDGRYLNFCIGEVKKWGKYKKQFKQLLGYCKNDTYFGFLIVLNQDKDMVDIIAKRLEILQNEIPTVSICNVDNLTNVILSTHKIGNKVIRIYHFIANSYNPYNKQCALDARR